MIGRTQVFEASAAYQVMVLAAALDAGAFRPADRRILLTSVNAEEPEVARRLEDDPAIAPLLARFDAVASYNQLVFPAHPFAFRPRTEDRAMLERAFRAELGIPADHVVELALESVHVPPARSILSVFADAEVTVYAEGLMSYGPTRDPLPGDMVGRIRRLLHLDLVPGLVPVLLSEYGVPASVIASDAFVAVVRELADAGRAGRPTVAPGAGYALVLGQYLAALGLLSDDDEAALYADLVEAAVARGFTRVVFRPHPSAPARYREALTRRAAALGVALEVDTGAAPVEVRYELDPPALVLGCFSTGLVTARRFWSLPAATLGAAAVLAALPRVEDSNRIPLVLVDRTVDRIDTGGRMEPAVDADPSGAAGERLQRVVRAVAYAMQWRAQRAHRAAVARHLADTPADVVPYVPRRRLRHLLLPGGAPLALPAPAFERFADGFVWVRRRQVLAGRAVAQLRRG